MDLFYRMEWPCHSVIFNKDIIAQNIKEILLNENYSLSIKADDMYASILLSFDISS